MSLFSDKLENRRKSLVLKLADTEKEWLVEEAKRLGVDIVTIVRMGLREIHKRSLRRKITDVGNQT